MEPKQKVSSSISGAGQKRQHYLGKALCNRSTYCGISGASLVAQLVKNLPAMKETQVQLPGSGRSPGKGDVNPLPYSCLQSPTDRGAWQDTVQGVARVRYDLVTKPPPRQHLEKLAEFGKCGKEKIHSGGVLGSGMTMANLGVSERQHCIFKAFEV